MPSFTVQVPDLKVTGPVVEVELAPSALFLQQFKPSPIPTIKILAMIDTGASGTVIQSGQLAGLGIHPVGSVSINTPSHQNVLCNLYDVQFRLPNRVIFQTKVIEAPMSGQPIQMLIGRDVLRHGILVYLGENNQFSFSV
jgi:predicted aspartyl protease